MKIENSGGDFIPADEGTWNAVCVDVTPLVKRETKFGMKEEFRIVFELVDAPLTEKGERQCVWSRGFTPMLVEKANLRKFLRQWRGRDLNDAERAELDTESFIGQPAQVLIQHEEYEGKTYANIIACTPYKGAEPLAASGKFVRKKDRPAQGEKANYKSAAKPTADTPKGEKVDNTQAGEDWTTVVVHVGQHKGIELRDLDKEAIEKLIEKWVPIAEKSAKPTADDRRLVAALKMAKEFLANPENSEATDY